MPEPRQDMHVHSTFSDGANTLAENVAEAESLGLVELGCVDHVRVDTDWVPAYAAAVAAMREQTAVRLQCGIEAKLLDTAGALDLPEPCPGVDAIYAADHQVPLARRPAPPARDSRGARGRRGLGRGDRRGDRRLHRGRRAIPRRRRDRALLQHPAQGRAGRVRGRVGAARGARARDRRQRRPDRDIGALALPVGTDAAAVRRAWGADPAQHRQPPPGDDRALRALLGGARRARERLIRDRARHRAGRVRGGGRDPAGGRRVHVRAGERARAAHAARAAGAVVPAGRDRGAGVERGGRAGPNARPAGHARVPARGAPRVRGRRRQHRLDARAGRREGRRASGADLPPAARARRRGQGAHDQPRAERDPLPRTGTRRC